MTETEKSKEKSITQDNNNEDRSETGSKNRPTINNHNKIISQISFIAGSILGIVFTYLFCWKEVGISHLIFYFIVTVITALLPLITNNIYNDSSEKSSLTDEKRKVPINLTYMLMFFGLALSGAFLYRLEQWILVPAFLLLLVFYAVVVSATYNKGVVKGFGFTSFFSLPFHLIINWFAEISNFFKNLNFDFIKNKRFKSVAGRVVIGLLVAIPFIILFTILLSSADKAFADFVQDFLKNTFGNIFADFSTAMSTLSKIVIAIILSIYSMIYYYGVASRDSYFARQMANKEKEELKSPKRSWDAISVSVFLFALNIVFVIFLIFQIKYLFGGEQNIIGSEASLNYADYARRGFGELSVVSFLVFLITMVLSVKTQIITTAHKLLFKINSVVLVLSTMLIGYSAFMRLGLLQEAYGFTGLRMFGLITEIFISIMLLIVIISLFIKRTSRLLNLSFSIALILYCATFILLPMDRVVAELNYQRFKETQQIDVFYLFKRNDEVIPVLVRLAQDPDMTNTQKLIVLDELEERYNNRIKDQEMKWQSYNITKSNNKALLDELFKDKEGDSYWSQKLDEDLKNFAQSYSVEITEGDYKEAYDAYWSSNTVELDRSKLVNVDITEFMQANTSYSYTDGGPQIVPGYYIENERIEDQEFYLISGDMVFTFSGLTNSLNETITVILENGEWKIADSTRLTLGFYFPSGAYEPLDKENFTGEYTQDDIDSINRGYNHIDRFEREINSTKDYTNEYNSNYSWDYEY